MKASMTSCFLLLASLTLTAPIHAQNLLANPEFDDGQGLGSWFTTATGTWTLDADAGSCTQSNSALGTSAESGGGSQFLNMYSLDCIAVDPLATPTLYLGATYKTTAQVFARVTLQFFSQADCNGSVTFSSPVVGLTSPNWFTLLEGRPVPDTAASARVRVDFNPQAPGVPQYTAAIDRIYVGAGALIYADPFEADGGSACRWSASPGLVP
ncbi:MAG: hypothetical protein K8H90_08595 [Thermoanaerobaculia bacterium]|nr:hypothetical protein [Thermoanaerobaculia bacterium]